MSDNDDVFKGRILSRREILGLIGSAGAALLVACSDSKKTAPANTATSVAGTTGASTSVSTASMCVVRPEVTEGPYFVDDKLNRSDIRSDPSNNSVRPGTPLALSFTVMQTGAACAPLAGAQVDVWHCDAAGVYSDTSDPSFNTVGQKFLRGYQVTDDAGSAKFTTIYPGWYQGRAVHIHFKIRTTGTNKQAYEFTSQLFFDDSLTDQVHAAQPYAAKGNGRLRNSGDDIFKQGNGQLTLTASKSGDGYSANFGVALDLSDTKVGASDSNAGGPGGGPGGPGGPPPGGFPPGGPNGGPPPGRPGGPPPGAPGANPSATPTVTGR